MSKMICDVCGAECDGIVCCSACGAVTVCYCEDCYKDGAEPWDLLVSYISCAGYYPKDIGTPYREIVKATCERLHKTEIEFSKAVENKIDGRGT